MAEAGYGGSQRTPWHPSVDKLMARRKSLISQLHQLDRDSANVRAARGGPASYGKRVVRRKVYGKEMGATRSILKAFGLSK